MSPDDNKLAVQLSVAELREIVRQELAALQGQQPRRAKIAYRIEEAAELLSVPPTWLAKRCRDGEIPVTRLGHYVTIAECDLLEFAAKMRSGSS